MTTTSHQTVAPAIVAGARRREQTRARYPDLSGYAERDGVRVFYEVYGSGEPTIFLLPTWSIVHSRLWKAQIPYLARHFRIVTFDGRGNGCSDRPVGAAAYTPDEFAADALAVMDATATDRTVLTAVSCGALWARSSPPTTRTASTASSYLGPAVGLAPNHPERDAHPFDTSLAASEEWAKYNSHYWRRDYLGFLEFFFAKCFTEPHSSKQIED